MSLKKIGFALAIGLGLSACGQTVGDQALGGAAIGAGVAAVTDGSLGKGAAIGAGANVLFCQANPGRCG